MIWLLSPYTKGSSVLYRKFVHPTLSNKEKVGQFYVYIRIFLFVSQMFPHPDNLFSCFFYISEWFKEIDEYITQAKDRSYETMMRFGKRGLNLAANAAVTAATKVSCLLCDVITVWSEPINASGYMQALTAVMLSFL